MRKIFGNKKPPKPTPLPPPEPPSTAITSPPLPPASIRANSALGHQHSLSASSLHNEQHQQQQSPHHITHIGQDAAVGVGSRPVISPSNQAYPGQGGRSSFQQPQPLTAPARSASQGESSPDSNTWVVVEAREQQQQPPSSVFVRPQPSFESRSSSLGSLPPGASPYHNSYSQSPTSPFPPSLPPQPQSPVSAPPNSRRGISAPTGTARSIGHPPSISDHIQPLSSSGSIYNHNSSDHLPYEASIMSQEVPTTKQEKPRRGLFGFIDRHSAESKEKATQQDGPWDLTRMVGYVTATASDDWTILLEICERASVNEAGAKEAAKALKSEFKYADPPAMLIAARLWAIMLLNTTPVFLVQCSTKKFLDGVEEALTSDRTSPVVKERLLFVLAGASFKYGGDSQFSLLRSLWKKVKPKEAPLEGIAFDPNDPMFSPPARRLPRPGYQNAFNENGRPMSGMGNFYPPPGQPGAPPPQGYPMNAPPPTAAPPPAPKHRLSLRNRGNNDRRDNNKSGGDNRSERKHKAYRSRDGRFTISPEEDMTRLFEECEIARGNAQLLSNSLVYAKPDDLFNPEKSQVIKEFYAKCGRSQHNIAGQIAWATAGAERSRALQAQSIAATQGANQRVDPETGAPIPITAPPTVEEELLAALLQAHSELDDAFRTYSELERLGIQDLEEREVKERSKHDTRAKIQYYSENGSPVLEVNPPPHIMGTGSSRSPSPAGRPLPQPLPAPPGHQNQGSIYTHRPNGSYSALLTPNANSYHPQGPRVPGSRSRSPSPDGRAAGPNGVYSGSNVDTLNKGLTKLGISDSMARPSGEDDDDLQTPVVMSDKAKGKQRAVEPPVTQDLDQDGRSGTPQHQSDVEQFSDSDFTDDPYTRKQVPVHYAYDAAAEREKELRVEEEKRRMMTATTKVETPNSPSKTRSKVVNGGNISPTQTIQPPGIVSS